MLVEVAKSIEIAYELCDIFTLYDVDMEVHADINTNPQFKSNEALREAMAATLKFMAEKFPGNTVPGGPLAIAKRVVIFLDEDARSDFEAARADERKEQEMKRSLDEFERTKS